MSKKNNKKEKDINKNDLLLLQSEIYSLKEEISKLKTENQQISISLKTYEGEISDLILNNNEKNIEISELKNQILNMIPVQQFNDQLKSKDLEIFELNKKLEVLNEERKDLQESVSQLQFQLTNTGREEDRESNIYFIELQNKYNLERKNNNVLKNELEEISANYMKEIKELTEQINSKIYNDYKYEENEDKYKHYVEEIERLKNRIIDLETLNNYLTESKKKEVNLRFHEQKKAEELQNEFKTYTERVESQYAEYNVIIDNLFCQLQVKKHNDLIPTISDLLLYKDFYSDIKAKNQTLTKQIELLDKELYDVKITSDEKLATLRKRINGYEKITEESRLRESELTKKIGMLEKRLSTATNEPKTDDSINNSIIARYNSIIDIFYGVIDILTTKSRQTTMSTKIALLFKDLTEPTLDARVISEHITDIVVTIDSYNETAIEISSKIKPFFLKLANIGTGIESLYVQINELIKSANIYKERARRNGVTMPVENPIRKYSRPSERLPGVRQPFN